MKTVLVIGAGFSGVATAVQLLRQARTERLRVILLNRSGRMGRGLAYGTQSPDHTLNVPAGNMSALDDDTDHFLDYARGIDESIGSGSFVSRRMYGNYLETLLNQVEKSPPSSATLERLTGQVTHIALGAGAVSSVATLEDGRTLSVDRIVLAVGNFQSNHPHLANMAFYSSARYIRDPWDTRQIEAIRSDEPVLLLGTGLTAIDVAMSLLNRNPTRRITAASRRGLLPQQHRPSAVKLAAGIAPAAILGDATTVRAQLRAFRLHTRALAEAGYDWREALTSLRPATAAIWQGYSDMERRRFLRHVQPYWDSHRHRIAPAVHERFNAAVSTGVVQTKAARIVSLLEDSEGVSVTLRPRGSESAATIRVARVINCTGPSSDMSSVDCALVRQLLTDGMVRPDRFGLGLSVSADCALVDAQGKPSDVLFYIGPWLKAQYWEATAVPELRRFARQLAFTLLS